MLSNFPERRLPFDGLIGIRSGIVLHRMGQAAFALQMQCAALPQFSHGMSGEKFRCGALTGRFPGDGFCAVFAELKR
ncbi:hypothetical protein PAP10c_p1001 (plasmid) [Pantoea agglomerans]|nr:hypothetical protein PAP10c_p1001 [Pantoea agglomerans]